MDRRKFLKSVIYGAAGAGLVISYPIFSEKFVVNINHYKIYLPNLPKEFTDFKILQLTDLHYGFMLPDIIVHHIIKEANTSEKDIIICTGDYVNSKSTREEIDYIWSMLCNLKSPQGVYSVLGNHDHKADEERSIYWLEKSGQNLRHKTIPIVKNGERIWIGGSGDLRTDVPKIDETFGGIKESEFKILLAHNPDTADSEFETKIDLIISGHTHGGQISIPFLSPIVNVKNKRYIKGLIKTKDTNLFICKGIGCTTIPFRFNCPPEIAILHLFPMV
jgi:predicted MPP superfamily phosphohydrolase